MTFSSIASPALPPTSDRPARAPGLRRLIGPAALAAALAASAGAVSVAKAAECVNGYRTLGNQVIVLCDDRGGAADSTALYREPAPLAAPAAPAVTGASPPRASRSLMADGLENCQPGMYWTYYLEDGEVILAC